MYLYVILVLFMCLNNFTAEENSKSLTRNASETHSRSSLRSLSPVNSSDALLNLLASFDKSILQVFIYIEYKCLYFNNSYLL